MRQSAAIPAGALYVHVPFCRSRCSYCDFVSRALRPGDVSMFIDGIERDIRACADAALFGEISSLYVGGGTPTVLGSGLVDVVRHVSRVMPLAPGAEVTVEANPESVDERLVESLLGAGVGRFSLGVQSLDDQVLHSLGRVHDADTALHALDVLTASGARVSVDLMCGIPGLSRESWEESLNVVASSAVTHISVYPLTIEEGTLLSCMVDDGTFSETDADEAAAQMVIARDVLQSAGFERYETANFARGGDVSIHNTAYWTGVPYLGIGPGAASMLPVDAFGAVSSVYGAESVPEAAARVRFTVSSDVDAFLAGERSISDVEFLDAHSCAREDIMLRMRRSAGVDARKVSAAGLVDIFASLVELGLVQCIGVGERAVFSVTERGWLLGNEVFGRIWAGN